jgi:hypothetical protein
MPSLLPGYEYDIFISYRQNDNKYDQWVTEFVGKLKSELEATIKDRLSVYFDSNPHDGILETHNVDKSLEGKLRALIFIPIVSNTYCDTNGFAWKGEFVPFKELASADTLGLDIRLPNGNVASRILPVKIHDIDEEDVRQLETELKGILRSVDFIYNSAGVNRPLRHKDDDLMNNKNGTIYRNQINKVANAVKEIITGIKKLQAGPSASLSSRLSDFATQSVTATVPEKVTYTVVTAAQPTVFLAWTSQDLKARREEMAIVLQKAGLNVIPNFDCPSDEALFMEKSKELTARADCSLHLMSGEFGRRFEANEELSFPRFQFEEAKRRSEEAGSAFHTIVWHLMEPGVEAKSSQSQFINYIRNNITRNMMFSNSPGPMQLVDDIRSILFRKVSQQLDTKDTDIFFIFNQQDEPDAQFITDAISGEYPIETLNIQPDGEEEYREKSKQQIPRSKLAVIYFRYAADWALPFIKQVWKQVGGASSPTPIMLVGEDDPKSNSARIFKAPRVMSTIVPKQDVPQEIKKFYVKVIEK